MNINQKRGLFEDCLLEAEQILEGIDRIKDIHKAQTVTDFAIKIYMEKIHEKRDWKG